MQGTVEPGLEAEYLYTVSNDGVVLFHAVAPEGRLVQTPLVTTNLSSEHGAEVPVPVPGHVHVQADVPLTLFVLTGMEEHE